MINSRMLPLWVVSMAIGVPLGFAADVQPVSRQTPLSQPPGIAGERLTFSQQPALVGDRVAQSVVAELQLSTQITQFGQAAHASDNRLQRRQQRFIEVLEVADGNVRRARVNYPLSRLTSPEHATDRADAGDEVVQPVEGRSYFATRDGERLLVTDLEGAIPSQAEFEIVVASLQNLGLPNPLVKVLLSSAVRVGERLELPRDIAQQLMGFGDQFGEVSQFDLVLKSLRKIDGQQCAVFAATIEAVGEPANPVRVRAFGQVVIQTETCRIVRAELSGPLTLSKVEQTSGGSFEYSARGSMRAIVESKYGHAQR